MTAELVCAATDWCGRTDEPYGRCTLPLGHDGNWHTEMRDGKTWAQWRGPNPGETCSTCGKDGREH